MFFDWLILLLNEVQHKWSSRAASYISNNAPESHILLF